MEEPKLTVEERNNISNGSWFAKLSPSLRHDILRCAYVRRFNDGDMICARGDVPDAWTACAKGAVRVCSTSVSGRQVTLTYIEPGLWFGDISLFDGESRSHDTYAHGQTSVLCVGRADFKRLLSEHTELYEGLLWIAARRSRQLFSLVEDLNTLPLRARLSKQINYLARSYGVPANDSGEQIRISLQLAQEELAQLVGASRQRVNQELKALERQDIIRIEPSGLVVRDRAALITISESAD